MTEGEVRPQWQRTNENGQVFVYPHLDMFDETTYEYLTMRLDATDNPKLKARYAHILWESPKKHGKFAKIAVDSYLETISIYEEKYDRGKDCSHEISEVVINAYSIARRINYKVEKIKSELKRLIQKFSSGASFSSRDLIQFMLKPKKGFSTDDFDGLENVCWQLAESFVNDGHTAIGYLTLGEKVDRRLEKQSHNWILRIAEHYEAMMELFEKGPNVALVFCLKAIRNYKRVRDKKKVRELEQHYTELKDSMEFQTSEVEIDITKGVKESRKFAKNFVEIATSEEIISCLISDPSLLPTHQEIRESVKELFKKSPTLHLLPKVVHDRDGNVAQHFSSDEEKVYFSILESYELKLKLGHIPLINAVLIEAILNKKLTIDVLLSFLNKHCWYGKKLARPLPDGQTATYNWLSLIAPALDEYFHQMDFHLADPTANLPNFVLSLDSLTLKIEGLFRDLCRLSGITTSRQRQDNSGRNITVQKDIDALLREDEIQNFLTKTTCYFSSFC